MQTVVIERQGSDELAVVYIIAVVALSGLGLLLSGGGLISILVSGGARKGLPWALGGLAMSGLAMVVGPVLAVAASAREERASSFMEESRIRAAVTRRHPMATIAPRPTFMPVPSMLPIETVDDPFQELWPTAKDPLPAPLRKMGTVGYLSVSSEKMAGVLSMAGVEALRGTHCRDAAWLKLEPSLYRIYAFRLDEGGDLKLEPDGDKVRTVTLLARGEIRIAVVCGTPGAERDPDYSRLVDYFRRRLAGANFQSR